MHTGTEQGGAGKELSSGVVELERCSSQLSAVTFLVVCGRDSFECHVSELPFPCLESHPSYDF